MSIFTTSKFTKNIVTLKSQDMDYARRRYILNVLLLGCFVLSFVMSVYLTLSLIAMNKVYNGVPPVFIVSVTLLFLALYFFSRAGKVRIVPYIFVLLCFIPAVYTSYIWGVDIPQALLAYVLTIVIAGVLIGTKFSIIVTFIVSITLFIMSSLQNNKILSIDSFWRNKPANPGDIMIYIGTLIVITIVSWLFNREIEKALKRAQTSEKALQKERDLLEVKVEKRTAELQRIQLEKVMQIYRFADFGKLAAGLFHDLVTPLNVVSLNLENLKEETDSDTSKNIKEIRKVLRCAIYSTKGIEKFVKDTRFQLQGHQTKSYFNLTLEIGHALKELVDKTSKARVKLDFSDRNVIYTFGNPFRFHQMIVNLVSNAIDSYANIKRVNNRNVDVRIFRQDNFVVFEVEDFGVGISHNILPHIFDPFYTTKPIGEGIGIGLTICKDIAEKDFGGSVTVKSQFQRGTIFRVQFPRKKLHDAQEHT